MALKDDEKAALAEALSALPDETLETLGKSLEELDRSLQDANSAFPETQKFLRARGLTHVRQLDKKGMQELKEHLERTLQGLCKAKA